MKPGHVTRIAVLAAVAWGAALALAFDGGAPDGKTGAPSIGGKPAEGVCADCHNDFPLNIGGMVEVLDVPTLYQPGSVYMLTVRVTSSQTAGSSGRLWGFELTAVRMSDGTGTGTFANVAGQGTQIVSGNGQLSTRRYVQVGSGNRAGSASPVTWQVQWTAPNPGVGSVGFYASGMAANGDGNNNGDWVYTGSATSQDITPTLPVSWGQVKRIYH